MSTHNTVANILVLLGTVDSVVRGSRVVLPDGSLVDKNIVIDEGQITGFSSDVPPCDNVVNADGLLSIPGLIDTHVHYGVYSPIDKAAVTESHAAAIGGVTTMMRMLRLGGSYKRDLDKHLEASADSHYVDYALHASVFNHNQIQEMEHCVRRGVLSFKLYMNLGSDIGHVYMDMDPYSDDLCGMEVDVTDDVVRDAVRRSAELGCPVLVHAEDYESCSCGMQTARQKNQDGLSAWSASRSPKYEAKAISKVSRYAREFDCTLYFVHIGSAAALAQIQAERRLGTRIFVESCPHYLALSFERQDGYLAKVMPPVRSESDVARVWSALSQNEIDTIGTDHVANRLHLKLGGDTVWDALAGFPGVGTSLPILLSEGLNKNRISLQSLVQITSRNAARIFGMHPHKGLLEKGADADITIVDLKLEKAVSSEMFGGFSDYTVYDGWKLCGWPVKTLVRGRVVADDFEVVGERGYGIAAKRNTSNV